MSLTAQKLVSKFNVSFTGCIESGQHLYSDEVSCAYQIVSGSDWMVSKGSSQDTTMTAVTSGKGLAVFNHPISLAMQSSNIAGWPRIVVTIFGLDFMKRKVVKGYGLCSLPVTPGKHSREIHLFAPTATSTWRQFMGWLTGKPAEIVDPVSLVDLPSREGLRVFTVPGKLTCVFNVAIKDHQQFEFNF
jgi:B9 domain-containing protein 1